MKEDLSDIRPERIQRFKDVIAKRQLDLTVVLENVHDPHNLGAVMRSCDAVGISEIYVIYNAYDLYERGVDIGKNSSTGVKRWIDVHLYKDPKSCFHDVRQKYKQVFATHLGENASSLYELDLVSSTALVFGNEHKGLSKETLSHCDGNFIIPQEGMVQSLNISVACAISIFEASRQRHAASKYENAFDPENKAQSDLLTTYIARHRDKKGYKIS